MNTDGVQGRAAGGGGLVDRGDGVMSYWVTFYCRDCAEYYPENCVRRGDVMIGPFDDLKTAEAYAEEVDDSPITSTVIERDVSEVPYSSKPDEEILLMIVGEATKKALEFDE